MAIYNRRQAALLLSLVVAAGLGIAISHWRRTHPELADRLEQLDRSPEAIPTARADAPRADPRRSDDRLRDATRGDATRSDIALSANDSDEQAPRVEMRTPHAPAATRSVAGDRPLSSRTPPATPVDLNHATVVDLQRLPGIGPVLAARIVGAREASGPFDSVEELRRVGGIGEAKLERVRPLVTVRP